MINKPANTEQVPTIDEQTSDRIEVEPGLKQEPKHYHMAFVTMETVMQSGNQWRIIRKYPQNSALLSENVPSTTVTYPLSTLNISGMTTNMKEPALFRGEFLRSELPQTRSFQQILNHLCCLHFIIRVFSSYTLRNQTELMELSYLGRKIIWNPRQKPSLIQANASVLKRLRSSYSPTSVKFLTRPVSRAEEVRCN